LKLQPLALPGVRDLIVIFSETNENLWSNAERWCSAQRFAP